MSYSLERREHGLRRWGIKCRCADRLGRVFLKGATDFTDCTDEEYNVDVLMKYKCADVLINGLV
jgi:hypothetical protein